MTTVSGDLRLVTDVAAPVSQVWVRAPRLRAADGAVVAPLNDHVDVRDGRLSFECRPGPARVTLIVAGSPSESFDILVAGDQLDLAQAVADFDVTVGESEESLAGYVQAMREVQSAVHASEGVVSRSAERAGVARDEAEGFASAANDSAAKADERATAAARSRSAASADANLAKSAQSDARHAQEWASKHKEAAEGHATSAESAATRSENAANRLWDSVAWNGDRLSVADRQSEPLTGPRGPQGDVGPRGATGERGPKGEPGEPGKDGAGVSYPELSLHSGKTAIGEDAKAWRYGTVAIAPGAESKGWGAVAIGEASSADGDYSIALGENAKAPKFNGIAIGQYAQAKAGNSVAIGFRAVAENSGDVVISGKKIIVNKRDILGELDTIIQEIQELKNR